MDVSPACMSVNVCAHLCTKYVQYMCSSRRGPKKASDPGELMLQTIVNCHVLEIKTGSSPRTASALKC